MSWKLFFTRCCSSRSRISRCCACAAASASAAASPREEVSSRSSEPMIAAAATMNCTESCVKSRCTVLSTSSTPQAAPSVRIGTLASETMSCSFSVWEIANSGAWSKSSMQSGSPVWKLQPGGDLRSEAKVADRTTPSFQPVPATISRSAVARR